MVGCLKKIPHPLQSQFQNETWEVETAFLRKRNTTTFFSDRGVDVFGIEVAGQGHLVFTSCNEIIKRTMSDFEMSKEADVFEL